MSERKTCVRLITGYKTTGKDTLCDWLLQDDSPYDYLIYARKGVNDLVTLLDTFGYRASYADELKKDTKEKMVKSGIIDQEFDTEKYKDSIIPGTNRSFRSFLIEELLEKNKIDPDYYTNKLELDISRNPIVTDWRYATGLPHIKSRYSCQIITIRVYRACVKVNPKQFEHELDDFATDYLFVPTRNDYNSCCKVLPQYSSYSLVYDSSKYR